MCVPVSRYVYIRYPIRVISVDTDHIELMLSCASNEDEEHVLWH